MESINQSEKRQARGFIQNAAESMSLPEPLRNAYRLAQSLEPPDSFETIARAQDFLVWDYLNKSGHADLDSYRVAARVADILGLKLQLYRDQRIAGGTERWAWLRELKAVVLQRYYAQLPLKPHWKNNSGAGKQRRSTNIYRRKKISTSSGLCVSRSLSGNMKLR